MRNGFQATDNSQPNGSEKQRKTHYSRLFRRFILLTIVCSLIPLLLVGWGINIHYTRFSNERMINAFQIQVEYHRKIIELFLKKHSSKLHLIAQSHPKDYLLSGSNLNNIFEILNREYRSFTDLGIIGADGYHLKYIGPYDLMPNNYADTFWFKEVMEKDLFISDMFMGFRKVPHFIIAVTRLEKGEKWILRATIETEVFRSLVENVRIGNTGEVYLLNTKGIFQTSPRFSGKIMDKAPTPIESFREGINVRIIEKHTDHHGKKYPRQIYSQTWLKDPPWLLVVKQNYDEAFSEVNHANYATLILLHLSALIILIVAVFITRHMISVIKNRDDEADKLNRQLLQTSKLASIGELSAGVAHEINNPLAIILTEKQILLDMTNDTAATTPEIKGQLSESLEQIDVQIKRCKRITHGLLRFSRRTQSVIETINTNQFISEVIELLEREAGSGGIKFFTDFEENLPNILSDPSQLQQVMLNLITNSIDAHDDKAYGSIHVRTRSNNQQGVEIVVADTGMGISPENMDKIFDPFFTTKPVGKGTGLGLSICYSTIKNLGGDISVWSEVGKGSEFKVFLPFSPPPHLLEGTADNPKDYQMDIATVSS
ncbi:MAG: ATP-binding protein [Desulfobacterales bacterium]|nr:ATP-binding protein [Desulfobacterales bacterium]